MATDWPAVLVQGSVQLLGTAIGGAIAAFTGFQVAERNAKVAQQAKADERARQRDDYQKAALTDLLDALGEYNGAAGRELREMESQESRTAEAEAAFFTSGGRVERIATRLRNQQLRDQVMTYRRLLLHLITVYERGNLLATTKSITDPFPFKNGDRGYQATWRMYS